MTKTKDPRLNLRFSWRFTVYAYMILGFVVTVLVAVLTWAF
jgi:hypothetical protein